MISMRLHSALTAKKGTVLLSFLFYSLSRNGILEKREKRKEESEKYEKKRQLPTQLPFLFGDPPGIRTPDTLIKSQVLCQLS